MGGEFYEEMEEELEGAVKLKFDPNEYHSITLEEDGYEITISEKSLGKINKIVKDFWKAVKETEEIEE